VVGAVDSSQQPSLRPGYPPGRGPRAGRVAVRHARGAGRVAVRHGRGAGVTDPTVADPDLLAGRLFFGVPVPGPARAPLEAALPRLKPLVGGARLAPPGGWHLTLAFLGQVQPELADEVVRVGEAAVAGVGPARLRLEGAGTFPQGRRARVLWTGIGGDAEVLVRLAAALSSAAKAAGLRSEERPLAPHLTLARFSTPAPVPSEALDLVAAAAAESEPWEARELACFRSTLGGPRGARYRVVREFPLTG
ncbi:MAG TPA: RNA 2',3'-cyclic phosphodiesterase, partial [Actinomycetota bacterium]|nr:RNA 2',3'-cyclic phosphodiesterase [Actinomycetota bacterium]